MCLQVGDFQVRKQTEINQLTAQLHAMQASITKAERSLSEALQQQAATADGTFSKAVESQQAMSDSACASMAAASESMQAALAQLTQSLDAQSQQLQVFAKEQQHLLIGNLELIKSAISRARDSVTAIGSAIRNMDHLSGSATTAAVDSLSAFVSDFDCSMTAKQGILMTQITSLLGEFVQQHTSSVAVAVSGVKQQLTAGKEQLGEVAEKAAKAASICLVDLQVRLQEQSGMGVNSISL